MPRKKKTDSASQSEHSDSNDENIDSEEQVVENQNNIDNISDTNDDNVSESEGQGLSLNILINVRTLLETAIKRGAYKPNELSTVGKIYDIFNSSLNYIESQDNSEDNNSN